MFDRCLKCKHIVVLRTLNNCRGVPRGSFDHRALRLANNTIRVSYNVVILFLCTCPQSNSPGGVVEKDNYSCGK